MSDIGLIFIRIEDVACGRGEGGKFCAVVLPISVGWSDEASSRPLALSSSLEFPDDSWRVLPTGHPHLHPHQPSAVTLSSFSNHVSAAAIASYVECETSRRSERHWGRIKREEKGREGRAGQDREGQGRPNEKTCSGVDFKRASSWVVSGLPLIAQRYGVRSNARTSLDLEHRMGGG